MNTKALRQKILDLAIHGKLVPQDPNDEPASVLLERIRAEKERLIKEGKIKRPKKSKTTSDKPHYPYELPKGWVWTTLPELCVLPITDGTHQTPTYTDKANGIPFLSSKDVTSQKIDWTNIKYITKDLHEILYKRIAPQKNDILLAKNGTTGVAAIVEDERVFDIYVTLAVIRPSNFIDPKFLLYIINSVFCKKQFNDHLTGIGLPNLHLTDIKKTIIPVPPYKEQVKIVDTINRLFKRIDVVDKGRLNTNELISQTKAKILDLAIHGKLVPQDPTDEPASKLLKRINPKAEITSDNGHYQKLPEGWCECKLSDVCVFDNGYAFNSDNYNDCGIPLIRISNITNTGSIDLSSCVFIKDVPSNKFIVKSGDLLIAMSGATTGKMGVYLYEENALLNQRVGNLKCTDAMLQQYRNYYMFAKSDYILKIAYGGAQPNISAKAILDIDVMLPPLKEQHRIVSKIEEIFAQLDAIEASL